MNWKGLTSTSGAKLDGGRTSAPPLHAFAAHKDHLGLHAARLDPRVSTGAEVFGCGQQVL